MFWKLLIGFQNGCGRRAKKEKHHSQLLHITVTVEYVHSGAIIHNELNRRVSDSTKPINPQSKFPEMEAAASVLSSSSTSSFSLSHMLLSSYTSKPHVRFIFNSLSKCTSGSRLLFSSNHSVGRLSLLRPSALTVEETVEQSTDTFSVQPKIDKSGRFCCPRAARELALYVLFLFSKNSCLIVSIL